MARRLLSIWFPRLASDISLRNRPVEGPLALSLRSGNTDHLHCLNPAATARGLHRGMALADARAICAFRSLGRRFTSRADLGSPRGIPDTVVQSPSLHRASPANRAT